MLAKCLLESVNVLGRSTNASRRAKGPLADQTHARKESQSRLAACLKGNARTRPGVSCEDSCEILVSPRVGVTPSL